jgi:hypothetical protein
VVYVFEFFIVEDGGRRRLDRIAHRAKSVGEAKDRARAILKNTIIRDEKADICLVKDQRGNTLSVIQAPG